MKKTWNIIAVTRDERFSPHSVGKDRAILKAVVDHLPAAASVRFVSECDLCENDEADTYVSMARGERALRVLGQKERQGRQVVNSARGVAGCQRSCLDAFMRAHAVPMPPLQGSDGYWLKRGDASAQTREDVCFCPDEPALEQAKEAFSRRGVTDWVVSTHVVGDLVKFYAVGDTFFRYYYPTDDGISKFGDEAQNGAAHHYAFDAEALRKDASRLAGLINVDVYGGDAIVDSRGRYYIIDFNDWPSFSRCCDEAAEAIANDIIKNHANF